MSKYITSRLDNAECLIKRAINKLGHLKKSRIEEEEVDFTIVNLFGAIEIIKQVKIRMQESDKEVI